MQIAITILVILIVGAFVGTIFNFAGLFLGIPIVFIFIGAVIGKEALERQRKVLQMKRFRRSARARKVTFTETDKQTMV
jgi:uncharacterized membrane protein YdjX (TVP38/TMEM64 family)